MLCINFCIKVDQTDDDFFFVYKPNIIFAVRLIKKNVKYKYCIN